MKHMASIVWVLSQKCTHKWSICLRIKWIIKFILKKSEFYKVEFKIIQLHFFRKIWGLRLKNILIDLNHPTHRLIDEKKKRKFWKESVANSLISLQEIPNRILMNINQSFRLITPLVLYASLEWINQPWLQDFAAQW